MITKTSTNNLWPSCLDAGQGASEEWTELYLTYSEGTTQLATKPSAKSICGAACSAGWQANAAGKP